MKITGLNKPQLSICIPTYNRLNVLKQCLDHVIPQVEALPSGLVEVVLVNNASTDGTADFLNQFAMQCDYTHAYHNPVNLGFDGNTAKCIEYAQGDYIALLSDDDIYTPGAVQAILDVLDRGEYALVFLNYYGFIGKNVAKQCSTVAPDHDVEFDRAMDAMNYPSVGHFSGFIYNSDMAKKALSHMLSKSPIQTSGAMRQGVYFEVAVRVANSSDLPAYFIGARKLAARTVEDHCTIPIGDLKIHELCLDYYELMLRCYKEGLLTDADLDYRKRLVLSWLPRAIVRNAGYADLVEMTKISDKLRAHFKSEKQFNVKIAPLLTIACHPVGRFVFRRICHARGLAMQVKNLMMGHGR